MTRMSWIPVKKFGATLLPRTGQQLLLLLLGLCCFGVPIFYVFAILFSIGVAGSMLGLFLWTLASVTRAALAWYLKYLIPW